jgi:HK97 family phage major capsid protein
MTVATKTPGATERICAEIKGLGGRLDKTEGVVEGLIKLMKEPGAAQVMRKHGLIDDQGMVVKAALAESVSGAVGGYTVPPQFAESLLTLPIEGSVIRPRAYKHPMTSLTATLPYLDVTTAQPAGVPFGLGGVVATWTAEAATRTESEPAFRQMELKAHELSFYSIASNNLLADNAVGLDSLLTQLFSTAIDWFTDFAYLQGNGVGKPLGVLNAPATILFSRAVANRFTYADCCGMLSKLYLMLRTGGALLWAIHPSVVPQLLTMTDPAGRLIFQPINQGAQEAAPGGAGGQGFGNLLGYPVVFTEKLPVLGTQGDVALIDCSKYVLGDRMSLQIDVSPHVKFLQNSMVWRVVWRGDGQPWLSGAVTLADGAYTVSPFVVLK